MKIPDELFSKWKLLRSQGDGKKISEEKGVTQMDISRAFTTQECSDDTFNAMAEYYKAKEEKVKEYL